MFGLIKVWILSRKLKHRDLRVRQEAAESLGELENSWAINPLTEALRETSCDGAFREFHFEAIKSILESLVALQARVAVEAIVHVAIHDSNHKVRSAAAMAVGTLSGSTAPELFASRISDADVSVRVRLNAVDALGTLGSPEAVERLLAALRNENDVVRDIAADRLSELGTPGVNQRAIELLLPSLLDSEGHACGRTIRSLEEFGWEPQDAAQCVAVANYLAKKAEEERQAVQAQLCDPRIGRHDWDGCVCRVCGETRITGHVWDGCICTRCSRRARDCAVKTEHDWDGCICRKCGEIKGTGILDPERQSHDWDGCVCRKCRVVANLDDETHDWDKCTCRKCGATFHHDLVDESVPGRTDHYVRRCRRCGFSEPVWTDY